MRTQIWQVCIGLALIALVISGLLVQTPWADRSSLKAAPESLSATQITISTGRITEAATRSNADLDLLARVVAAEAEGEPATGQAAVAAVILNRVADPGFPNSLNGVIFQPHAFESVTNGLIWRRNPDSTAVMAARQALNGMDPTYGCLFFWNPSKPVSRWIWSRQIVTTIGAHVFAR